MKKIITKKNLLKLIGLIIFIIIIITQIDLGKFYSLFLSINPWFLIAVSFISIPVLIANMFRWYYILRRLKINYPIGRVAKIYFLSNLLSIVTPFNSGDIIGRISFLKKDGFKIKTAFISYFIDRTSALIVLLIITIVGILLFLPLFGKRWLFLPILALILIITGFLSLKIKFLKKLLGIIFPLIIPQKNRIYWEQNFKETFREIEKFSLKDFSIIFALTVISQTSMFLFSYFLARLLGIHQVPVLYFPIVNAIATFVVLIPISVSGLGTREATILAMFSFFGVQNELTIIFSLLFTFISTIPVIIIGAYFWLSNTKSFKMDDN